MKHLFRLLRGELALEIAFWNWAVCGGLVINIVSSVLFLFLIIADRPVSAFIVGYAFSLPYNVIATVGMVTPDRNPTRKGSRKTIRAGGIFTC